MIREFTIKCIGVVLSCENEFLVAEGNINNLNVTVVIKRRCAIGCFVKITDDY